MLLMILMAIPLIGAFLLLFIGNKSKNIPLITSAIVFLLSSFGLKGVFKGEVLFL